jgi:hypothetical protein
VTEETRQDAALAIKFRGRGGGIGPYHVYCSPSFEKKFGWNIAPLPDEARNAVRQTTTSIDGASFLALDRSSTFVELTVETISTPYALIALFTPTAKSKSSRRWLHVG